MSICREKTAERNVDTRGEGVSGSIARLGNSVREYWRRRGVLGTSRAVLGVLLRFVVRHRCSLVFQAVLTQPREPSVWSPMEKLFIVGKSGFDGLDTRLVASAEPEKCREDRESIREGNYLFIVAAGVHCLHRGYVCTVVQPGSTEDSKRVFFGEFEHLPVIRGCITTPYARTCGFKGLYARTLNEELRYLQSLGHDRAVLYTTAENTPSIKGAAAAGFYVARVVNDWVLFRVFVFQRVYQEGRRYWRIVLL
jgi:hypothetical protein